jgi:hypothetical protein
MVQGDLKQDFSKIATELNLDGKAVYAQALALKGDTTTTVLQPRDTTSTKPDASKM